MLATLLVAGAGACGGGSDKGGPPGVGGMMAAGVGGMVVTGGTGGAPGVGGMVAGGTGGAGGQGIALVDWVTDLTTNYGNNSAPDTVDDKNIVDNTDPAAFDPLLQR